MNGIKAQKKQLFFTTNLLSWNALENRRVMPWKGEKDPYRIWLSEIILQQTRVEQGLAYYNNFIKTYPTIKKLADAPEKEVFKLWEGLGYYTRCKNLLATAAYISNECNGRFPSDYELILELKGIGPYTAAAISSFAFNLPHAVVDGNVIRVLSRFFGISISAMSPEGKKTFANLAQSLLDKKQAGLYNQAIMDFGATICKPMLPACTQCVMRSQCVAFNQDAIQDYPVKIKKAAKKQRWFYYVLAEYKGSFLIRKRSGKDIWQNLHEFILTESDTDANPEDLLATLLTQDFSKKYFQIKDISKGYQQELTHQTIKGCFIHIVCTKQLKMEGYHAEKISALKKLAFPKFITQYFVEKNLDFVTN
jgi:A/G-specific adenine glycosylase